jgi:hypothetical protein
MQVRTLAQVLAAVTLIVAGVAHAAPQEIVQLQRVVVTGKAHQAPLQVVQLPRVIVVGVSTKTQLQRELLASNATRAARVSSI